MVYILTCSVKAVPLAQASTVQHAIISTTMAANPRPAPNLTPIVPKRAPTTQLSMIHPGSSLAGDPSRVMLRPLHQAHGESATVGDQPTEYVSYVQEISESQLGQIETPEQKLIDPVLTEETKSTDKVIFWNQN